MDAMIPTISSNGQIKERLTAEWSSGVRKRLFQASDV